MTVEEFLKKHGQSAECIDTEASMHRFREQMRLGLRGEGGMPMIPTYLANVDRASITTGKRILIDAGGTNFRSAIGYFDASGGVHIEEQVKTVMPASDGYMSKSRFYERIADNVKRLLPMSDTIGFCFSYPVDMGADIDGYVRPFTKEVKAPEVVGTRVGRETVAACKAVDGRDRRIVILNDTVATLLGGMALSNRQYSGYLGYIYGTGTNICYIEDTARITKGCGSASGRMLVNTECGTFDGFVRGDFDEVVISATDDPHSQLFEKMTAGKYLAAIMYQAMVAGVQEGVFTGETHVRAFTLRDVSEYMEGEQGLIYDIFSNDEDRERARRICDGLTERAAKMGAIANATLAIASCTDTSLPVAIVAEGTTFNKLYGYRRYFDGYLTEILHKYGIRHEIVQGEELNLVGTLMATMALGKEDK